MAVILGRFNAVELATAISALFFDDNLSFTSSMTWDCLSTSLDMHTIFLHVFVS